MIRGLPILLLSLFVACLFQATHSARILGIFPVYSRSHHALNQVILRTLASRGHDVTVLSFLPQNTTTHNYKDIGLSTENVPEYSYVDSITLDLSKKFTGFYRSLFIKLESKLETDLCNVVFNNTHIQGIFEGKISPPDLLIVEMFSIQCYSLIAEKFDLPVIVLVAPTAMPGVDYAIGNTNPVSYVPGPFTAYTQNMNFGQRLVNTLQYILGNILQHTITAKRTKDLAVKYLGDEGKDITLNDLHKRISLVLYNTHFSFINRPNVPNAIDIGGIHIVEAKPLPEKIQKFIDEAQHGAILVSFGTTFKTSSILPEKLAMFRDVFSKIPQRVLWRMDKTDLINVSQNVMLTTWLPQRDILEHKNVKAFISHGGIFGTFEAIYTETPIVGIPFMFDQFFDIAQLEEKGTAIALDFDTLTHDKLFNALNAIVNDPKYYQNMQKLSSIFRDRPMSPLDTAIYWTEYVLRHKGAPHIRNKGADMPSYQYFLLDVIAVICLVTLLSLCLIVC